MDKITFRLEGFDKLIEKFVSLDNAAKGQIKNEFAASTLKIQSNAKKLAPVNLGNLRNSIVTTSAGNESNFLFSVAAKAKYAPYVEFGTGGLVSIPQGYEDFARLFKGRGIKKINLRARPFLIPAFEQEKPKLLKRIKDLLNA